ncbi:MAG: hypothetical protein LAP40_17635 [Acidobacteriia bacterium]|nr:hypothetical protein [Terriglobia bacterium]
MKILIPSVLLFALSCASRRPPAAFRVLPANPSYLLRAPDASETPFREVLSRFTGSNPNWVDLRPGMELRIENAYYREGAKKHDLRNYLGTAVARYEARAVGLRLAAVESGLETYPAGQPAVRELIRASQRRYKAYRFFYEVLFNRKSELRGAVLLGAGTAGELDRLAVELLADPGSVCGGTLPHCTIFPETCTVSLEMEIVVNGAPKTVEWGSVLASVAARPRHLELLRLYGGRLTPVEIDPADSSALRLPLLPGDRVTWD